MAKCPHCNKEIAIMIELPTIKGTTAPSNQVELPKDQCVITATITGRTEKALLLDCNGVEQWMPRSTIHNIYDPVKHVKQSFTCDKWIVKKNFPGEIK